MVCTIGSYADHQWILFASGHRLMAVCFWDSAFDSVCGILHLTWDSVFVFDHLYLTD